MQFLLTFLATIASLSASALVGVHAAHCAVCSTDLMLDYARKCYNADAYPQASTVCYYKNNGGSVATDYCSYDDYGYLVGRSGVPDCPRAVNMSYDCPTC